MAGGLHPATACADVMGHGDLEAAIAELRATLATQDEVLAEQCSLAALEEQRATERKLETELEEARTQISSWREVTDAQVAELAAREEHIKGVQRRLEEAEQQEQLLREREERRRAHQAALRKAEADHRSRMDKLRSDIRRTHDRRAEKERQLRRGLAREEQECAQLAKRCRDAKGTQAAVELLGEHCENGYAQVRDLEASTAEMQHAIEIKTNKVEALIECSLQVEAAAEEKDQDAALQSEVAESEAKVQELAQKSAQLRQVDHVVNDLTTQLQTSEKLVADMEVALTQARAQLGDTELPDEPPGSWPLDQEHLEEQLAAMRCATGKATASVGTLEIEEQELQARLDTCESRALACQAAALEDERMQQELDSREHRVQELARCIACVEAEMQASWSDGDRLDEEYQHEIAESKLHKLGASLDAKGRRLQLLLYRVETSAAGHNEREWFQQQAAAADQKAVDLEAQVAQLGARLDEEARRARTAQEGHFRGPVYHGV